MNKTQTEAFETLIGFPGPSVGNPYQWVAEHEGNFISLVERIIWGIRRLPNRLTRRQAVMELYRLFGDSWGVAELAEAMGVDLSKIKDEPYIDRWLWRRYTEWRRAIADGQ